MHHNMARMGGQSVAISMNELSNHDHSRFLTRTNRTVGRTNTLGPEAANNNVNKAVFKEAVVMQMTLPGAPTVYYGDKITDPADEEEYSTNDLYADTVLFWRYDYRRYTGLRISWYRQYCVR